MLCGRWGFVWLRPCEEIVRNGLLLAALTGAALLSVPNSASAERPAQVDATRTEPVQLSHRTARGQSRTLTLSAEVRAEAVEGAALPVTVLNLELPMVLEVQSVADDGVASVSASFTPVRVDIRADDVAVDSSAMIASLGSTRLSFTVSPTGAVSERSGNFARDTSRADTGGTVIDTLSLAWIEFPSEPVAIGESWMQTVPLYLAEGNANLTAQLSTRYTLAGYVMWGGREQLLIDSTYSTTVNGTQGGTTAETPTTTIVGRGSGDGFAIVDPSTGNVVHLEGTNGAVLTYTDSAGVRTIETIRSEWTLSSGSGAAEGSGEGTGATAPN